MESMEKTWSYTSLTAQAEETIRSSVLLARQYPKKAPGTATTRLLRGGCTGGGMRLPGAGKERGMRNVWKGLLRIW